MPTKSRSMMLSPCLSSTSVVRRSRLVDRGKMSNETFLNHHRRTRNHARSPFGDSAMRHIIHHLAGVLTALACLMLQTSALADSVPFWGATSSVPIDTPIAQLKKGQFLWMGKAVTTGPLVMVVSITEQRAYLYRNGVLIGATTVSTGRPGHTTPIGVFTVLQKQKEHRSTIYDAAPMPYMERLTWGGVALHAGGLPGYPESHGCIHLPSEFARQLFEISNNGMTVVIGAEETAPTRVAHPGYLAPVKATGGQPFERVPFAPIENERWHPELSPTGPVSIVLSQGSRRVVVYRNGIEIGRARLEVSGDAASQSRTGADRRAEQRARSLCPRPGKYSWLRIGCTGSRRRRRNSGRPVSRRENQDPARVRCAPERDTDCGCYPAGHARIPVSANKRSSDPSCRCGSPATARRAGAGKSR